MANIMDYLDWRGDVPVEVDGINEVDGLILSQFAYLPFEGIIGDGWNNDITIAQAGRRYFEKNTRKMLEKTPELIQNCSELLRRMMTAPRYMNMKVNNYVAKYDPMIAKQFAAVTVEVTADTWFVNFRGTDDTLAGWEEDFKACYMTPVASQIEAERYLDLTFRYFSGQIYVGGHSKGGNLAMYSSIYLNEQYKSRLIKVYNYDGPGFLLDVIQSEEYTETIDKIQSYMPQGSVVGMIMYHEENCKVVLSVEKGLMQHKAVTWEVLGKSFVYQEKFKNSSIILAKAIKAWVNEISQEERELFIEIVFKVLRSGSDTVTGLTSDMWASMNTIFKSYKGLDKTTKKMVRGIVGQVIKLGTRTIADNKKNNKSAELLEEK